MADDFEIIGRIVVDQSGAVSIKGISDDVDKIKGSTDTLSNTTSAFGDVARFVWANIVLEGIKAAITAVTDFAKSTIASAMESAGVIGKMNSILEATGYAAGMSSDQLQNLANQLQGVTAYSDETILTGATMLLTFRNIGTEVMERTIPDMLDMATIFGSVDSAAMQLGKALNDPVAGMGALGRAGVTFSDAQKETIKALMETGDIAAAQDIILDELEAQVKGVAEAYGQTFGGQIEIAKNKLDGFKESMGQALINLGSSGLMGGFSNFMASPAVQGLQAFFDTFNENVAEGSPLITAFSDALKSIGGDNTPEGIVNLALAFDALQLALNSGATPVDAFLKFFDSLTGMGDTFPAIGQSILDFFNNIDWDAIAAELPTQIGDAINGVDFTVVGTVIGGAIKGLAGIIIYLLKIAFTEADWSPVMEAIWNALGDIVAGAFGYSDWDALAVEFMMGLEYALVAGFGYMRWEDLAADFAAGWQVVLNFGSDTAQSVADWWTELWSNFNLGVSSVASNIANWWTELWINFDLGVSSIASHVSNWWNELWTNFNLGVEAVGQSIADAVNGLIDNAFANLGIDKAEFLAQWEGILTDLGLIFENIGGRIATPIAEWWTELWANFDLGVATIATHVSNWWTELWANFNLGVADTGAHVDAWWTELWSNFGIGVASVANPIADMWNELWSNFDLGVGVARNSISAWWTELWSNFNLGVGASVNALSNWWRNLWSNFNIGSAYLGSIISTAFSNALASVSVPLSQLWQIGVNIAWGIRDGITNGIGDVVKGASDMIESLIKKVKEMLGIASPSSVFKDIAKDIIQGLIDGWKSTVGLFLDVVGKTVTDIGNFFGIDLSSILGGGGASASGLGTAGGGVASTGGTSGTSGSGSGTVINQYFYGDVSVGAMSDLISFDCTVNPVVNSTYPGIGGLGGGPVGVTPI